MSTLVRWLVPVAALGIGAMLVSLPGGCSRKGTPDPATVRGKVTFQGQPLAGGLIVFSPDPDRGGSGKPIRGDLDADGTFQLKCVGDTTIPPGWYRVAIASASLLSRPSFPSHLARPDRSELVREVKAGQENVFEFAVEVPNP